MPARDNSIKIAKTDNRLLAEAEHTGSVNDVNVNQFHYQEVTMADDKTLGQVYYEEVEALKTSGVANADAVRQVAEKHGKKENAVRGGIHQYKSRHLDGTAPTTSRRRRGTPSVDDLVSQAKHSLEQAQALIDREVDDAKTALDTAQAHYDQVVASVKERKADIEKKLKALA
jgi:hypothetical protein